MPPADGATPWRAFAWLLGGELRAHPGRALLALAALAVGVALGYAVHIVNQSALDEFSRAMATVSGRGDFEISARPDPLDEALYGRVAALADIADLVPIAEAQATVTGPKGSAELRLIGTDALRAAAVSPALLGRPSAAGRSPLDDESLFLPASVAARLGLEPGAKAEIEANGRRWRFVLAGDLPALDEEADSAVIDIAAFQWRFDRLGKVSRIIVKARPGLPLSAVARELGDLLPPGAQLSSRTDQARRNDALSRAYRVNLDMLALVALITGAFLTFSGQSLSVARRSREFALLRMMGVRRRTILRYVLAEGLVLGALGAGLGLLAGAGLAGLALRLLGGDLGGGYFHGVRPALELAPGAAALFAALGIAAALLGSLWPARTAAALPPVQTLKGVAGDGGGTRARLWPGLTLLLLGGACALAPPVADLPLFGYLAVGLILAGGVAAMPWLLGALLRLADRGLERRPVLFLALKPLSFAPRQASIALAGLVASTSLTIAMAIMVTSFRHSVDVWLGEILSADLYLRVAPNAGLALTPEDQARIAATPGVATMRFGKTTMISLAPDRPAMALVVRGETPEELPTRLPMVGTLAPPAADPPPVLLSEPAAQLLGRRPGDLIEVPLGGALRTLRVGGVFRDYSRQFGALAIDKSTYFRLTGDATANEAAIIAAPGSDRGDLARRLGETERRVEIADSASLRAGALDLFDRSFLLTYAIEAVATLVGMAGVAATISAQTLARAREFGMLRHLGVRRREIAGMLLAEGTALGVTGVLCGLGLGGLIGTVLIDVVNPQSFHWTMETVWPVRLLAAAGIALVAAAALSARLAGRAALSGGPLMAVREDF